MQFQAKSFLANSAAMCSSFKLAFGGWSEFRDAGERLARSFYKVHSGNGVRCTKRVTNLPIPISRFHLCVRKVGTFAYYSNSAGNKLRRASFFRFMFARNKRTNACVAIICAPVAHFTPSTIFHPYIYISIAFPFAAGNARI